MTIFFMISMINDEHHTKHKKHYQYHDPYQEPPIEFRWKIYSKVHNSDINIYLCTGLDF